MAWDRLHPLLVRRSAWADHPEGDLPVSEGTVIRLQVDQRWTAPKLRELAAAHTQLPLARAPSQKTSVNPGNDPHAKGASRPPASAEDFAASTRKLLSWPAHRNPAPQVRAD
ncbi:hypothetical protein O3S80_05890 [Streptomyces sp. Lzd4kr]|nr:hypothetical protein [Streptomyces sp. Lzd4kr]